MVFQAPRAEVVLVLSRSRSVTPADRSYDLIDAATYNFINSSRPPKILESPLDSKSLSAGETPGTMRHWSRDAGSGNTFRATAPTLSLLKGRH